MTTRPDDRPTAGHRRTRRLAAGLALLVGAASLYGYDGYLKSSEIAGFVLPEAEWQVQASHLPEAWNRWRKLDAFDVLQSDAPNALHAISLAVRKLSGVRPTPDRLRLWLGRHFIVGGDREGWCLSARPGIALRVAALFLSPSGGAKVDEGAPLWAPWTYGWRDGFFLLASSRAYLDRVRADGVPVPRSTEPADTLTISWTGALSGSVQLKAEEHLPVVVTLNGIDAPADAALVHAEGWPGAMCWAAFGNGEIARAAAAGASACIERAVSDAWAPAYRSLCAQWWRAYGPFEHPDLPNGERAIGIFNANFNADIPDLETAWTQQGRHRAVLDALATIAPPRQHRWNDTAGWLYPMQGQSRAWAAAYRDDTLYIASHEHLMAVMLDSVTPVSPTPGAASISIRWEPFGTALAALLRRAAGDELLPGYNTDDVDAHVTPVITALKEWGSLEITLAAQDGALAGGGFLALTPEAE